MSSDLRRMFYFVYICSILSIIVDACARTRSSPSDSPGLPVGPSDGPGLPSGSSTSPPNTKKECPALDTFTPQPADEYQLISPESPEVSGDTTTASCPSPGTSLLLPDGEGAKPASAALTCSSTTGIWSFADGSSFDATTTPVACGAKCMQCSLSSPIKTASDLKDPINIEFPASACDTPTFECNADNAPIGITKNGDRYDGIVAIAPYTCVGGKFVDADMNIFDQIQCANRELSDPDEHDCNFNELDTAACSMETGRTCVSPASTTNMAYTGKIAFLYGQRTAQILCPPEAPLLFMQIIGYDDHIESVVTLNTPLSEEDAAFSCFEHGLTYYLNGVVLQFVYSFACVPVA